MKKDEPPDQANSDTEKPISINVYNTHTVNVAPVMVQWYLARQGARINSPMAVCRILHSVFD